MSFLALLASITQTRGEARSAANADVVQKMLISPVDQWTEEAIRQPGGPSYEYFEKLLPPLRYVDTAFRVYPIPLSAPGAAVKARLIGDGRGINLLARQPNWRGERGLPVTFRVGQNRATFGEDPRKLDGPKYAEGYLPIVQIGYRHGEAVYAQESFAGVEATAASHGSALVRFSLAEGSRGKVEAQFESAAPLKREGGTLRNEQGKVLAGFDEKWTFNVARNTLVASLMQGDSATIELFTQPADGLPAGRLTPAAYERRRAQCAATWKELLGRGMSIDVSEPRINHAWRAALIGSFALLTGDEIRYSHGNQYAKLYVGEGGDAVRSFILYGYAADAAGMLPPLFVYTRKNLEFHQAAFKLQTLAHYFRITRDHAWLEQHRDLWQKEIAVIVEGRERDTGMLPREKYCGDIETKVYSLNSNANSWRALRDMALVLDDLGEGAAAKTLADTAADYRGIILAALEQAVAREVQPPFLPIALSGEEKPYEFIPGTRMGGYWNIMIQYVLGSRLFPARSPMADQLIDYLRSRGGLVMGMLSTHAESAKYWMADRKINDLYGMRYALALLERDEPDRALASLYGKLAHGFTRDTFICGEGSDLVPLDEFGRMMYLPPNSAGNASFLQQLRHCLVQECDFDDDGRPETLRLLFATPRPWLADGETISVQRAPTAFGQISLSVRALLNKGEITAEIELPPRPPAKTLLRLRLPAACRVTSARIGERALKLIDAETLDLSGLSGTIKIEGKVARAAGGEPPR